MQKQSCVRWEWVVAILAVTVAASAGYAEEKPWSRAYTCDVYGIVQILGDDKVGAPDGLAEVGVDTTPIFGAGVGLNLNDHLNLNTEFMLGWWDTTETFTALPGVVFEHDDDSMYLWQVNLDYNILKGRLTPLVSGGIGVLGYNGEDRIHEIHFAYNVGAGVRWDIAEHFALRVLYRSTWWEITNADDPFQFDGVSASLIYTFK